MKFVSEFVVYVLRTSTTRLKPVRYNPSNLNVCRSISPPFLLFLFVWNPIFFISVLYVWLALEVAVGLLFTVSFTHHWLRTMQTYSLGMFVLWFFNSGECSAVSTDPAQVTYI